MNAVITLTKEIEALTAQIAAQRKELAEIENRTVEFGRASFDRTPASRISEAIALRARIAEAEKELAGVEAARESIAEVARKSDEAVKRTARWNEARKVARTLKGEFETATARVQRLNDRRDICQLKLREATDLVNSYGRGVNFDVFPTDEEIATHKAALVEAEEERIIAAEKYRLVDAELLTEIYALSGLRGRYEYAVFAERNLRPPDLERA